jgi:hypothetical protein
VRAVTSKEDAVERRYSLAAYERLLRLALEQGYRFAAFDEPPDAGAGTVLLRHDVDYSPTMAVAMAHVNAGVGVAGTFFLLLRGHVYNLLSPDALRQARCLLDLGQRVGVHVALPDRGLDDLAALEAFVIAEYRLLRDQLPGVSPVFSWHNPTAGILAQAGAWQPAGLVNAYHRRFLTDRVYLSDSNFRNSCADFERALRAGHPALHLLFHPINWVAGGESMVEVFAGAWPHVVREREREFMTNRVYHELFPTGMPEAVLTAFADSWAQAARANRPAQGAA